MGDLAESLGRNFERVVRWVYPGFLFLVLLELGQAKSAQDPGIVVKTLRDDQGLLVLIGVLIVSSFLIYSAHRYVLHELVYFLLYLCNWKHPKGVTIPGPSMLGHKPWNYWDAVAEFQRRRFKVPSEDGFSNYLMYAFAITHAIGTSGWLLAIMVWRSAEDSILGKWGCWPWVTVTVLLFAWVWQLGLVFAANRRLGTNRFFSRPQHR